MISWNTLFGEMTHLKSLRTGGTPLEPLLTAFGPPGNDRRYAPVGGMGMSRARGPWNEEL